MYTQRYKNAIQHSGNDVSQERDRTPPSRDSLRAFANTLQHRTVRSQVQGVNGLAHAPRRKREAHRTRYMPTNAIFPRTLRALSLETNSPRTRAFAHMIREWRTWRLLWCFEAWCIYLEYHDAHTAQLRAPDGAELCVMITDAGIPIAYTTERLVISLQTPP